MTPTDRNEQDDELLSDLIDAAIFSRQDESSQLLTDEHSELTELIPVIRQLRKLAHSHVVDPGKANSESSHERPTIGKYQVLEMLGRGGQAAVFLAVDPDLQRRVVLKLYFGEQDPNWVETLLNEGRLLARVQSRYVARCIAVERVHGLPYLVLEHIPGETLADRIAKQTLTPKSAVKLIAKIASAVAEIHATGLIHGDLKPANIVIGNDGDPRIVDFGLSSNSQPNSEVLRGTIGYMAPELVSGEILKPDVRTDIYSLGAIFYEMLTGLGAGATNTADNSQRTCAPAQITPPIDLNPNVPFRVSQLCMNCLAPRADRPSSVSEFLAILQAGRIRLKVFAGAAIATALFIPLLIWIVTSAPRRTQLQPKGGLPARPSDPASSIAIGSAEKVPDTESNPNSASHAKSELPLKVSLKVSGGRLDHLGVFNFVEGDQVRIEGECNRSCILEVWAKGEMGLNRLYPKKGAKPKWISPQTPFVLPDPNQWNPFEAVLSRAQEHLLVIAVANPSLLSSSNAAFAEAATDGDTSPSRTHRGLRLNPLNHDSDVVVSRIPMVVHPRTTLPATRAQEAEPISVSATNDWTRLSSLNDDALDLFLDKEYHASLVVSLYVIDQQENPSPAYVQLILDAFNLAAMNAQMLGERDEAVRLRRKACEYVASNSEVPRCFERRPGRLREYTEKLVERSPAERADLMLADRAISRAERMLFEDAKSASSAAKEAQEIRERILGADHLLSVDACYARTLASGLSGATPMTDTLASLNRCLEFRIRDLGDHPDTAQVMFDVAYILSQIGKREQTAEKHLAALEVLRRAGLQNSGTYVEALSLCGRDSFMDGNVKRAFEYFDAAESIAEQGGPSCAIAHSRLLINISQLSYSHLKDTEKARGCAKKAHEIAVAAYGAQSLYAANALLSVARVESETGDPGRAVAQLRECIEIYSKACGHESSHTMMAMRQLARVARNLKKPDAIRNAIVETERLLVIQSRLWGRDAVIVSVTQDLLGDLLFEVEEYSQALSLYEELHQVELRAFGPIHQKAAKTCYKLGRTYAALGDAEKSLLWFEKSLETHWQVVDVTRDILTEQESLAQSDETTHILDDVLRGYRVKSGDRANDVAFGWVFRIRGVTSRLQKLRYESVFQDVTSQEKWKQLREVTSQLASSITSSEFTRESAETELVTTLRLRKERLEREVASTNANFHNLLVNRRATLADLNREMQEDVALVEFRRTRHGPSPVGESPAYDVFVVRHSAGESPEVRWLTLPRADAIDRHAQAWRRELSAHGIGRLTGGAETTAPKTSASSDLSEALLAPIFAHIQNVTHLVIVPDGELAAIPWAALPLPGETGLVVDRYSTSVAGYSQQLCEKHSESNEAPVGLLAAGHIDYNAGIPPSPKSNAGIEPQKMLPTAAWPELPETEMELSDLQAIWANRGAISILRGADANEKRICDALPGARMIHLATHGYCLGGIPESETSGGLSDKIRGLKLNGKASSPMRLAAGSAEFRSGIVLAGANKVFSTIPPSSQDVEDGLLTAAEIESLDLRNADLVVLAACDSGLGEWVPGEDILGLPRAFQIAGTHTVLSSLWKVDDESTRQFMNEFYKQLLQHGRSKAESLRLAQIALRQRSPADAKSKESTDSTVTTQHWASWVLFGGWE